MKYWLHLHNTQPEQMLELAHLAERLGFEGVLGDDHWFLPADSADKDPNERGPLPHDYIFADIFVAGAAILAQTRTLKFGSCIMVIANRTNPLLLAKAASTLDRISNSRFVMGVGTGWLEMEYMLARVDWKTRIPRTIEMIDVMRKLWEPGPVSHQGQFFSFPSTYPTPTPHRPIPVYMGSHAPAALRRTGAIADGWMGMTAKLSDLPAQIAHINQGRRDAGRDHLPFEFMVGLARRDDGSLPSRDDYRQAEDLGITKGHFGPIEHVLRKPYPSFEEKMLAIEQFAGRVLR